jgi:hypothetical protein
MSRVGREISCLFATKIEPGRSRVTHTTELRRDGVLSSHVRTGRRCSG